MPDKLKKNRDRRHGVSVPNIEDKIRKHHAGIKSRFGGNLPMGNMWFVLSRTYGMPVSEIKNIVRDQEYVSVYKAHVPDRPPQRACPNDQLFSNGPRCSNLCSICKGTCWVDAHVAEMWQATHEADHQKRGLDLLHSALTNLYSMEEDS